MKSRQEQSCFELFMRALPSFNSNLLKLFSLTYLLLTESTIGQEAGRYKFFNPHGSNRDGYYNHGGCVAAAPEGFLVVKPISKTSAFEVEHINEKHDSDINRYEYDLVQQFRTRTFIGDLLCGNNLKAIKGERFAPLRDKTYENSDYSIDFSEPDYIEIEVLRSKRNNP
jgi:hypothetical protein